MAVARRRSIVTLVLCTGLHAFTHIFGSMLVPLYLLMVADLHLSGARLAALVVTIYGLVYNLNSYPAGVLADHVNRKWLLTIGLLGNALAIGAMGLSRHYPELVVLGILAGLFGSLFHPTANALVPSHFPENPGLAIGLLGIGSGVGFFLGPQVAGWRAQSATWHFANVADWQRPCIELAIAGIIFAMIFFLFARETRTKSSRHPTNADSRMSRVIPGPARGEEGPALPINEKNSLPISPENVAVLPARLSTEEIVLAYEPHTPGTHLPRPLFYRVLGIASVLGMRDFAGVAAMTLASIYLQKAFGYSPKQAGLAVGLMMLLSILVSPTSVYLTGGKRRLPMLAVVLITGGRCWRRCPCGVASAASSHSACFKLFSSARTPCRMLRCSSAWRPR